MCKRLYKLLNIWTEAGSIGAVVNIWDCAEVATVKKDNMYTIFTDFVTLIFRIGFPQT